MNNRTASIRTEHTDPNCVASAIRPDNTTEMETRVENSQVATTIVRDSTSGLATTIDDYVSNLQVADRICSGPMSIHDDTATEAQSPRDAEACDDAVGSTDRTNESTQPNQTYNTSTQP